MPLCVLYTNLQNSDIPDGFETKFAETVSTVLAKGIERVSVIVTTGQRMYRLGSTAPGCYLQIHSIGVFDEQRNPAYGPPLIDFLETSLNLPKERIIIQYCPLLLSNLGQPPK